MAHKVKRNGLPRAFLSLNDRFSDFEFIIDIVKVSM